MHLHHSHRRIGVAAPGFTLVEVLVVLAVASLLLSILLGALGRARIAAFRTGCAHNLRQIGLGMNMYLDDNDRVYPCADDPVSTEPPYWLWMGRGWRPFMRPYLGGSADGRDPAVLLCPEDRSNPAMYESTSYAYSMAFYHSPEQIDVLNDKTDTYSNPQPSIRQRRGDVADPAAKVLVGEWFSNHWPVDDEQGWWNWQGARNFLFADGHGAFLRAKQILPARDGLPDANLTVHGVKGRDVAR
jgi:prepilin-type N-terminal cleavage/methylation domain-containing protein/prepilin-type processing-associated H-X9-DG protein